MYEKYMFEKKYFKEAIPHMKAIAGAKTYKLIQGADNHTIVIELYTGTGFSVCIYPERGMDIGEANFCGVPLAFVSKAGVKSPQNVCQNDFSRYFFAGLLTTCGFDNVGGACEVNGDYYPGHGRINLTPAEEYHINYCWEKGQYIVEVIGTVRMAALFGENLVLHRSIKVKAGESRVYVKDKIINEGYAKEGYMLLYHCNFGYPIVSDDSIVSTNHKKVEFLDEQSREINRPHNKIIAPRAGRIQSAYKLSEPDNNRIKATIINKRLELGVYLETNYNQLDKFCEWSNLASQDYAIGLEPAKSMPIGRKAALEEGSLIWIQPQEIHNVELEIGVIEQF